MTSLDDRTAASPRDARARRRALLPGGIWATATGLAALGAALIPLLFNRRFYYADDTVNGALGQWYHLGTSLRSGTMPMLEPSAWSSGNLHAEGQWGFFNPVVWLISLGSTVQDDAALFVTVVKLVFVVVGAVSVHLLARDMGARPPLALLAGVTAPLTGVTAYFDGPSWATGLFVWALVPWFWYQLRRFARGEGGPVRTFVAAYLVITIAYVHGTIALIFVFAAVLVDAARRRDRRGVLTVLGMGVLAALVCVTVHLASLLTGPATLRADRGIFMDQYMSVDLSGLAMSWIPTAFPQVTSWWWVGMTAAVPMAYLTWALPAVAFVRREVWREILAERLDAVVAGVLFFGFSMLPTVVGPLRYPARMLPYVGLVVILLLAVALSRSADRGGVGPRRLLGAGGIILLGAGLAWAQTPQFFGRHAVSVLLVGLAVLAVWAFGQRAGAARRSSTILLGVAVVAATWSVTAVQHVWSPSPPWASQEVPSSIEELKQPLLGVDGDAVVVGNPLVDGPSADLWAETLQANLWYIGDRHVLNRYQLLGFDGFNQTLCLGYLGETCPDLLPALFEEREATGLPLADELSLDAVLIITTDVPEELWRETPEGWRIAETGDRTVLWVREDPLGPAGGVVSTSEGVEVEEVERSKTSVTLRVEDLPADGGRVVLSRLSWPGYTTSAGEIGPKVDGFLLSVDLPADAAGDEVTISFRPAGWTATIAALALAVTGAVAWGIAALVVRRRRARQS